MRKIRLFIAASLDGYIARISGEVDWLFTDQDYGYDDFFAEVDTVLMGRKTYEKVLECGEYPYIGKQGFVFSKTHHGQRDENVEFIGENLLEFVNNLRQSSGNDIWLVGGAEIIQYSIKYGFLDELILAIHPIILGDGIPLIVKDKNLKTKLKFKKIKNYNSGLLQVFYDLV
ncbi:MAG: dihydrofolate reductase [Okeania sp. SIO2C9]|uniref:dihydrofolate reductase family protein n=1 Tax=Okeania sp. SIO2C9 TaxID=2607791 RepID=UPI0013C03483|nr:dihydrofolate reductase family protein [Okeania sp. SIO2C9]NEQ73939.1 dihydrofolate reductase [Okeania sp. SIO2C9]